MVDMQWNPTKSNRIYLIYMYKDDLALNNLEWLICTKTQHNQTYLIIVFAHMVSSDYY